MPRVYLAVGHGLKPDGSFDPGTSGGGWTEQTSGDIVVQTAADFLAQSSVDAYSEAHSDDPNFVGSTSKANEWGADYVVAVHSDWPGAPSGAFVHWVSDAGKALADDIYDAIEDSEFPMRPSWHKYRDDLYILKNTHAPCVLVEIGKIGDTMLNEEHELEDMGIAIAQGILNHLGIDEPKEEDDMAHLSEDDQKWLAEFVQEGRDRDAKPPAVWHALDWLRSTREFFSRYFK